MDARWYDGRHVLVAGAGISGATVARTLLRIGAKVTVADRNPNEELADLGAAVITEGEALPDGLDQAIVSPGFSPSHPLVLACQAAGLEVFSEPELAWRLRPANAAPWLAVTGTNGKTTTVTMLAAILAAAGLRTVATGNIGYPLLSAVLEPDPYDVLAVELSSFQLHWSSTLAPQAGVLLNLADDHLEWHGGFAAYAGAKSALWRSAETTAVGNLDDERVAELLRQVPGRRIGFRLGVPGPGELGVVDGLLADRAFTASPGEAFEVGVAADVSPPGPHNVANALAAAALARSHGVAPAHVAAGIRGYTAEPHRNAKVATVGGVDWVDDSKATNPHAAAASLTAYPRVVWVAGGQLKGVDISDLVRLVAGRLAGAVLLGVDRAEIAEALRRHAPQVPVADVASTDDGAMSEVVAAAARLAAPGDTVLLAPAAASKDMYASYAERGKAFAAAVRALGSS